MRVLIVDDEPLVRIGIKSAIDWEAGHMEIVGEAADGEEAMKLILEHRPDVVMLDIKMPKKDGIEVLQDMKRQGVKAKVIILSGFDDFNLVKQAMKLGAADYFHKPSINAQEIEAVLHKIQHDIERDPENDSVQSSGTRGKSSILRNIMQGNLNDAGQTKLKEGNMYVLLFSVKKYWQVLQRYSKENATLLPNTIMNLVDELLSKEKEVECVQLEQNLYAVLISHSETKSVQASFTHVNDIVYLISSTLTRFVNIDTVFGISAVFQTLDESKRAAEQAGMALEQTFYHPNDPLFYYRATDDEQSLERANEYIAAMKYGLKEERYDEFANNLTEWEQFLRNTECMNERDVKRIYEGLMFMMGAGEDHSAAGAALDTIEDFDELSNYYHAVFNEKLKAMISNKNKEYSPLIRNIIKYIEANYRENISLKSLGEHFQVSANYISRLFNQEVGKGLFHYINELRIEKAKELLKDYRYKIYEVSELVGFNSQVHFAIVFQKHEGMSPKEYRKEQV